MEWSQNFCRQLQSKPDFQYCELKIFWLVANTLIYWTSVLATRPAVVQNSQLLGDFTFWLSPWLSLLAESKH